MDDDEDVIETDDGALDIGHNIGDNLATRAILAALIGRLAAERKDGPNFIWAIDRDATQSLMRVVPRDSLLEDRTTDVVDNFINAVEVAYETLTGMAPGTIHDWEPGGEED